MNLNLVEQPDIAVSRVPRAGRSRLVELWLAFIGSSFIVIKRLLGFKPVSAEHAGVERFV